MMQLLHIRISHKPADFGKFISKVYWLLRYEEKWEKIDGKIIFVIPKNKRNCDIDL